MKFNIGDEIRIINAGYGAIGCNGCIGVVTNDKRVDEGIGDNKEGFNVKLLQGKKPWAESGEIWRVNLGGKYELIKKNKIKTPNSNVHIHEQQPYICNMLVKNQNGEICEVQSITIDTFSYKVIYNGLTTIVIFEDGSKGIARCNPKDKYDSQLGYEIAFNRAYIRSLEKELRVLCNNDVIQAVKQLDKEISHLCDKGVEA